MIKKILENKSLRSTPFREEVLAIFLRHPTAISLSHLEEELKSFDRITLYRTLKTFTDKGIIHEIALHGVGKHMALCANDCALDQHEHSHEHLHFQCVNCDSVYCLNLSHFPKITIPNFKVQQIEVSAKGWCDKCNQQYL